MTAAELIERLQAFPPNTQVYAEVPAEHGTDWYPVDYAEAGSIRWQGTVVNLVVKGD